MNKIRKYKISKLSLKADEERYMRSCTVEDLNILNSAWRNSRWSSKFDLKTYMFSFASGAVRKGGGGVHGAVRKRGACRTRVIIPRSHINLNPSPNPKPNPNPRFICHVFD